MELNKALDILQLNYPFSLSELKKSYYKAALKHHPDKNPNDEGSTKRFQEIQEANNLLSKLIDDNEHTFTSSDNSYQNILNKFVYCAIGKNDGEISEIINSLIHKCSTTISEKLFDNMDKKSLHKLYNYLTNYADILNISKETVSNVREMIKKKILNDKIFTINPSLSDLFEEKVFKLEVDKKIYYVPLWHDEVEYEIDHLSIIVKCEPDMPEHIYIDHHNNLNINISLAMNTIYKTSNISFMIVDKVYNIPVKELFIKPLQTYVFKYEGIPKINISDIFDTSYKSDIIVHISIK